MITPIVILAFIVGTLIIAWATSAAPRGHHSDLH